MLLINYRGSRTICFVLHLYVYIGGIPDDDFRCSFAFKSIDFVVAPFFFFASSLEPQIKKSVKELGELLQSIKGGSQNPQQVSMMEVDEILRPLMDLMDGSLSLFAQTCEKPVLKRILRELWKLVIRILERSVVLPPMMDKSV